MNQTFNDSNIKRIEIGDGFDFIGDVHACYDELIELLDKLGYAPNDKGLYIHPKKRKIVSLGDIMSRGPHSIESMIFFQKHINEGLAYMIDSNHGWKIARWLDGRNVILKHGDEKLEKEFGDYEKTYGSEKTKHLKHEIKELLLNSPSHLIFSNDGVPEVVAVHAGIRDNYIGKDSKRIRDFCRYGDTDGVDEKGKPIRKDWFLQHKTSELILWGHDPKREPLIVNNTINLDQGVVFGGRLTAYRYPEKEFVFAHAKGDYSGMPDNPILL